MPNILDEYLIKLGSVVDASGMARFHNALREATQGVSSNALAMTGSFFKAQTEIVSGFAAIGSAALGLVDKVANADQEYRLFAMHMYMSKDAARSLKVAMDALGQPLENLSWDPELRARTRQLIADQRAMAPAGDFEDQMRKIRDIRFEFTRMEVEVKYLGMHVVQDFMKALGLGPDTLLQKLEKFNAWVTHNLPEISQRIVRDFMPIWRDVEVVFRSTGEAIKEAAVLFTNLVGLFTGDTSIIGTTANFDHMAAALQDVSGGFSELAQLMSDVEKLIIHLSMAASYLLPGNFHPSKALDELKDAGASITVREGAEIAGGVAGMFGGPLGVGLGVTAGHLLGGAAEDIARGGPDPRSAAAGRSLIQSLASSLGVDPSLAHALFRQESGESQLNAQGGLQTSYDKNGKPVAYGIGQLTASTARGLGVNYNDMTQNATGGMRLLKYYLDKYHDAATAVAAYHEGGTKMDAVLAGKATLSPEARAEVASVMRGMGQTGSLSVGRVVIHINQPNASPQEIQRRVMAGIEDAQNKRIQRTQQEFNQSSWAVGGSY